MTYVLQFCPLKAWKPPEVVGYIGASPAFFTPKEKRSKALRFKG